MKRDLLCWLDSPVASTGFGTVARHVLRALYNTGLYDIDILAINHFSEFYDRSAFPYQITPARLNDPSDPYGNRMLLQALSREKKYDILFIVNDTFVTNSVAESLKALIRERNLPTKIVYYYPVDSGIRADQSGMLLAADSLIAYTQWAKEQTEYVLPDLDNIRVIYHGTDTSVYRKLSPQERKEIRRDRFNILDDNTYLILNVNRNSPRKDLAKTVLAFSEFRKKVPNSLLYLHTPIRDNMLDLAPAIAQLGLTIHADVLFPQNYTPAFGIADGDMNSIYNAADCFLSTALGEGHGLSSTESMAAGVPVILGDHSSTPEILGKSGDRGLVYPCRELAYIDNSSWRKMARLSDITKALFRMYDMKPEEKEPMLARARVFTETYSWANIGAQWVGLFEDVLGGAPIVTDPMTIRSEDI